MQGVRESFCSRCVVGVQHGWPARWRAGGGAGAESLRQRSCVPPRKTFTHVRCSRCSASSRSTCTCRIWGKQQQQQQQQQEDRQQELRQHGTRERKQKSSEQVAPRTTALHLSSIIFGAFGGGGNKPNKTAVTYSPQVPWPLHALGQRAVAVPSRAAARRSLNMKPKRGEWGATRERRRSAQIT